MNLTNERPQGPQDRADCANFEIRGKREMCRLLQIHPLGTVDVERLSDGSCYRVSGLPLNIAQSVRADAGVPSV
jgi:hypothetical protein